MRPSSRATGPVSPGEPRVGVVVVYFGALPAYFGLTLRSMRRNPQCDFLFFTDQAVPAGGNISVVATTLADLRRRIRSCLSDACVLDRPYKVCDYRPAFGELFAAELAPYDYWGHADLDVILGDLSATLPLRHLHAERYDKVLLRGNFALYRNSPYMNGLFRTVAHGVDYRRVFATSDACHFDEWDGIAKLLGPDLRVWNDSLIFDIDPYRFRPAATALPRVRTRFSWADGRLLASSRDSAPREGLLIHLQKRRMHPPAADVLAAERFEIGPARFRVVDDTGRDRPVRAVTTAVTTAGQYGADLARFWHSRATRLFDRVVTSSRPGGDVSSPSAPAAPGGVSTLAS